MKVRTGVSLAALAAMLLASGGPASAAQLTSGDQRALRSRIEAAYDVVPLSDGIALRPKTRRGDVRLIEIAEGTIAVNGEPVTGRELRERVGRDAEAILRLSYLESSERRELFGLDREAPAPTATPEPPQAAVPPAPPAAPSPELEPRHERPHRARGDRVRIFGSVTVDRDEEITGQAVAVIGSVRVDGTVGDQVVAVLGSVELGPDAVVDGDVVSVGGRVRRAPGAEVRGGITEVALGGPGVTVGVSPWLQGWGPVHLFYPFNAVTKLIGSTLHLLLLVLLASIALLLARGTVEQSAQRVTDEPLKATLVGVAAQLLLIPVCVLTAVVLAISIIGIPLLLLMPFAILLLLLMALAGFSGAALAVGHWARRRFGLALEGNYIELAVGVVLILLPLLVGRLIGLAGWAVSPIVFLLVGAGLALEYLAWASGFGAVLTNAFARWQARRTARAAAAPPPA